MLKKQVAEVRKLSIENHSRHEELEQYDKHLCLSINGIPAVSNESSDEVMIKLMDGINYQWEWLKLVVIQNLSYWSLSLNLWYMRVYFRKTGRKVMLVQLNWPISLLPIFSKVFERLVLNALLNFLLQNKQFTSCKSGFIAGDSCVSQLVSITVGWLPPI